MCGIQRRTIWLLDVGSLSSISLSYSIISEHERLVKWKFDSSALLFILITITNCNCNNQGKTRTLYTGNCNSGFPKRVSIGESRVHACICIISAIRIPSAYVQIMETGIALSRHRHAWWNAKHIWLIFRIQNTRNKSFDDTCTFTFVFLSLHAVCKNLQYVIIK